MNASLLNIHLDGLRLIYMQCITDETECIIRYVLTTTSKGLARRIADMLHSGGLFDWQAKCHLNVYDIIRAAVRWGNSDIVTKLFQHTHVDPEYDTITGVYVPDYFKPNAVSPSFALYIADIAPAIRQYADKLEYFDYCLAELLRAYLPLSN